MKISPSLGTLPTRSAATKEPTATPVEPTTEERVFSPSSKALGTVLAGFGALAGRLAVPTLATSFGAGLGSTLGPAGTLVGGAAGLAVGLLTEFRNRKFEGVVPLGRVVGGMAGGFVGVTLGTVLDKLNIDITSDRLRQETKGFSYGKLFKRLSDVSYTSHPTLSPQQIDGFKAKLQPGDIVITNHDKWLDLEIPEALLGIGGGWSHTALYVGDGQVVEALWGDGVLKRPVDELLAENHHARILRPAYQPGQAEKAAAEANRHVGKGYDATFNLADDSAFGCVELVHTTISRAAPQIELKPHKLLGKTFLSHKVFNSSPDMEVIEDTGSSFFYNYLSKFS